MCWHVGCARTEEQLKAAGVKYNKGIFPFQANSRARANGDSGGLVKFLADATTDRILGIHIIGPNAGELIAEVRVLPVLERCPCAHVWVSVRVCWRWSTARRVRTSPGRATRTPHSAKLSRRPPWQHTGSPSTFETCRENAFRCTCRACKIHFKRTCWGKTAPP